MTASPSMSCASESGQSVLRRVAASVSGALQRTRFFEQLQPKAPRPPTTGSDLMPATANWYWTDRLNERFSAASACVAPEQLDRRDGKLQSSGECRSHEERMRTCCGL